MGTLDRTQSGISSSGSAKPAPQMDRSPSSPSGAGAAGSGSAPNADREQGDRRTPGDRRARIAEAAYFRAERRGFAAGNEDADLIEAEQEINRLGNNPNADWDKTE